MKDIVGIEAHDQHAPPGRDGQIGREGIADAVAQAPSATRVHRVGKSHRTCAGVMHFDVFVFGILKTTERRWTIHDLTDDERTDARGSIMGSQRPGRCFNKIAAGGSLITSKSLLRLRSAKRGAGHCLSFERRDPGLAIVVLSLGQHSR